MCQLLISRRIAFIASLLTAGEKLTYRRPYLSFEDLGRNVYPRKSKLTLSCGSRRLTSLQYTIFDLPGCISSPHSWNRLPMARSTLSACRWVLQCSNPSSAYRQNGTVENSRLTQTSNA